VAYHYPSRELNRKPEWAGGENVRPVGAAPLDAAQQGQVGDDGRREGRTPQGGNVMRCGSRGNFSQA